MNMCRQPLTAVAIAVCMSAMGCSPDLVTPRPKMFTGEPGGCGSCFVYRFNDTRTLAVTVRIDETAIDLSAQPVDIEIDSQTKTVVVEVLQFLDPAVDYFCDDVAGDPRPMAEWKAVAGSITFERTVVAPPKNFPSATHKVSVTLRNVQLKNNETGGTATLDEVRIEDVWVGWLPG